MEDMRSVAEVIANNPTACVAILYSLFMQMPKDFVLPTICTALDQWFADNDFTEEEHLRHMSGWHRPQGSATRKWE